ncbi:translation initiation factor IF-3, N-terminal domain protein [Neisseria polysaccharea ATCC 43768]|nr:translation initiation factor IF-3, N-terminal domain protein [Neisseria polysaccharea ATCC 43768]
MAEEQNVDLVEISPTAKPPVCKLMDYGKYKYQQAKKRDEAKKTKSRYKSRKSNSVRVQMRAIIKSRCATSTASLPTAIKSK